MDAASTGTTLAPVNPAVGAEEDPPEEDPWGGIGASSGEREIGGGAGFVEGRFSAGGTGGLGFGCEEKQKLGLNEKQKQDCGRTGEIVATAIPGTGVTCKQGSRF